MRAGLRRPASIGVSLALGVAIGLAFYSVWAAVVLILGAIVYMARRRHR